MSVQPQPELTTVMDQTLHDLYYDPEQSGSFAGVEALYRQAKEQDPGVSRKRVKQFLKTQDTYTKHRDARRHYPRLQTIVGDIDKQWQADLVDLRELGRQNSGHKFILTVIDCFSKYAWAIPLKKKDSATLVAAFRQLFQQAHPRHPRRLQTDKGKEFLNREVQKYLAEEGVHHFTTESDMKAAMVERFNRTIKNRMWRYFTANNTRRFIEVLPKLIKAYNNAYHRTIGMKPSEVRAEHVPAIWRRVYRPPRPRKARVKVGEAVRVSSSKTTFEKGYAPNWSDEVFRLTSLQPDSRPVYKLADLRGEDVKGRFYPEEIQSIQYTIPERFVVEKILKERRKKGGKELLIKWQGYSSRYNSWIDSTDLHNYE